MNVKNIAITIAVTAATIYAINHLAAKPGIVRTVFKPQPASSNG